MQMFLLGYSTTLFSRWQERHHCFAEGWWECEVGEEEGMTEMLDGQFKVGSSSTYQV